MYYAINAASLLFRVTSFDAKWPSPVEGYGAYFISKEGNRYNRPDQLTVYCSEDPLVAITEGAFYQALKWQHEIAYSWINALRYPLISEHLLWAFCIDPAPAVIDLEDPRTRSRFPHPAHLLLNPSREYAGSQDLPDRIRACTPPPGSSDPRPEGLKAVSVRTPWLKTFQPYHFCLFVRDVPGCLPYRQRSIQVAAWKLEFEFLERGPSDQAASYDSVAINWNHPRFRLSSSSSGPSLPSIPAFAKRPKAKEYRLNRWYRIEVNC